MKTLNKSLILIMLVLAGTANALHVESFVPSLTKIGSMIDEFRPLMDKPVSWCVMNETGEYEDRGSDILIGVKIKCDYRNRNKIMKSIYTHYESILKDKRYYPYIDSAFETNFPMYQLFWGDHQMSYDAFFMEVTLRPEYTKDLKYSNLKELVHFKVLINAVEQDVIYYVQLNNSTSFYISKGVDIDSQHIDNTMIKIKKEYKKDQSLDIQFIRIYDFESYETFVSTQR